MSDKNKQVRRFTDSERAAFRWYEALLDNIHMIDALIMRRKNELRYSWRPSDVNATVAKSSGQSDFFAESLIFKYESDRVLQNYERLKSAVAELHGQMSDVEKQIFRLRWIEQVRSNKDIGLVIHRSESSVRIIKQNLLLKFKMIYDF